LGTDYQPDMTAGNSLSDKFIKGVNLAIQRLIEQTKKDDGQLVFSKNGKIVHVKARDIK